MFATSFVLGYHGCDEKIVPDGFDKIFARLTE